MRNKIYVTLYTPIALLTSCNRAEGNTSTQRNFKMGVTAWSFGPTQEDVNNTYSFIENNVNIYTEQMHNKIPWDVWVNDLTLAAEFTEEVGKERLSYDTWKANLEK